MEVFIKELGSEFRVEWSAVRDESTSFGNITSKSLLEGFEFLSTSFPSDFVILKGVNKSIGLVHLSSGLVSLLLKSFLFCHLGIKLLSESLLKVSYFLKFRFSSSKIGLSFLEFTHLNLKKLKLWFHNFRLFMIITHSSGPDTHTFQGRGSFFGNRSSENFFIFWSSESKIWLE